MFELQAYVVKYRFETISFLTAQKKSAPWTIPKNFTLNNFISTPNFNNMSFQKWQWSNMSKYLKPLHFCNERPILAPSGTNAIAVLGRCGVLGVGAGAIYNVQ